MGCLSSEKHEVLSALLPLSASYIKPFQDPGAGMESTYHAMLCLYIVFFETHHQIKRTSQSVSLLIPFVSPLFVIRREEEP